MTTALENWAHAELTALRCRCVDAGNAGVENVPGVTEAIAKQIKRFPGTLSNSEYGRTLRAIPQLPKAMAYVEAALIVGFHASETAIFRAAFINAAIARTEMVRAEKRQICREARKIQTGEYTNVPKSF